jgi:hypothetical protein
MSDTRVFFAHCPARFDHLMAEFLYRTDPAHTACVANEQSDEYEALVDTMADLLVLHDGVMTDVDWAALGEEYFGALVPFPFVKANIELFRAFFPDAMVHVNGVEI